MRDCQSAVLRPMPIGAFVKRLSEPANLTLIFRVTIEIARRRERAGDQVSGIDRGNLAIHGSAASLHVEEVIVKASIAGRVWFRPMWRFVEESQSRQRAFDCFCSTQIFSLDCNRIRSERKSDGS